MSNQLLSVNPSQKNMVGRPKGSTTRTPAQKRLMKATESLYKDIEHMLTQEQKDYYELAYSGKGEIDPALEMQLFIRLFGLYVTRLLSEGLLDEKLFRDMGAILGHYRGAIKDLEDIQVKRYELKRKYKDDESDESGVFDRTRKSANDLLESFLGGNSR